MSKKLYDHLVSVNYMNLTHKIKQVNKQKNKSKKNGENKRII